MKLDRYQAAALPEAALLKAIPHAEDMARTAFVPAEAAAERKTAQRVNHALLHMPGITLPGTALWRRPGRGRRR